MQWPVLRRAFPWRTALLMCSIPSLALAVFLVWFRWELPPLQAYYLATYWESSRNAQDPASTTPIQWLYKAAPGRKPEPLIEQDVESSGSGLVPVGLSSSARQRGWAEVVKTPVQDWRSSELESFLQRYYYGDRSFRELLSEPLLFLSVVPIILLYGVILMWREIAEEWRQLYEGQFGDESIFDAPAYWSRCKDQMSDWRKCLIGNAKARLSRVHTRPKEHPLVASSRAAIQSEESAPSAGEKLVIPVVPSAEPTRYMIFPGAAAIRDGNVAPKPWDESQWID